MLILFTLEYSGIAGYRSATAEQETSDVEPLNVSGGERSRGEITHSMTLRSMKGRKSWWLVLATQAWNFILFLFPVLNQLQGALWY